MTFDTPQTRSLLAGQEVIFLRHTGPRDWRGALANVLPAVRTLRRRRPSSVVSTGAAVALPILASARALRIEAHYIESATRTGGPSLTGRLLQAVPGVHRYSQHADWADDQWPYVGSVFDGYAAEAACPPGESVSEPGPQRILVTLGTQQDFPFSRLVRGVNAARSPGASVLWQFGSTPPEGGHDGDERTTTLPHDVLAAQMRAADVVVGHAGVGTALAALDAGKIPVLVPRRRVFGEHVDDHQALIAQALSKRGLAIVCEADELGERHLTEAARLRAISCADQPLELAGSLRRRKAPGA
jgi:UDP-N-acetylglucosamine--N-acetylmuramyl-(pentapeptide) pyrophosphoryl-undecaprenol N-acetylglucosamine transferase